jgi:hypothetical protein
VRDAALQALQSQPALLGPYADVLRKAASSPSPTEIDDRLTELILNDAHFRVNILPQLGVTDI